MNDNWQETSREMKLSTGTLSTLVQILTLGIAGRPEVWEVEYKNRLTGQTVRGTGPNPAAAQQQAQALMG
jgi:hypothetical protein